jgi:ABC-type sugar transport system ATPase subunit
MPPVRSAPDEEHPSGQALKITVRKRLAYYQIDVSFTCPDEKTLVMIWSSGGGKTTLIRMIAGLVQPDEGASSTGGRRGSILPAAPVSPPQRRCLGYVLQECALFPHLSIYENAAFAAVDRNAVGELLERFGIVTRRSLREELQGIRENLSAPVLCDPRRHGSLAPCQRDRADCRRQDRQAVAAAGYHQGFGTATRCSEGGAEAAAGHRRGVTQGVCEQ